MSTSRWVIVLLVVGGLAVFILQNTSPSIALVLLGGRTVALPLAVWLGSAIALGALTAILFSDLVNFGKLAAARSRRRRWQVRPDSPADRSGTGFRDSSPDARGQTNRGIPRRDGPARTSSNSSSPAAPRRDAVAAEDWQTWGERVPPSQWDDWSQADNAEPAGSRFPRRQRQDRAKADSVLNDLDRGWEESARDTVYVPRGGSTVEDTLDDIAEGWEDWETEDDSPAATAYSYGYGERGSSSRVDSVYGPPDDELEEYQDRPAAEGDRAEDWGLDEPSPTVNADARERDTEDSEGVYDADYRVIIPPYRPMDAEDGNDRDRTP